IMLVAADPVEAERLRVLELVEILVVDVVALARIVERVRNVDPHRAVLGAEVVRQVRPRHQVEPGELHGRLRVTGLGARTSAAAPPPRRPVSIVYQRRVCPGRPGSRPREPDST